MKRGLLCIAAALVLAAGALWLASLRNYDAADAVEENGVLLYLRKDHGAAFASTYRWDGTGDAIDYVIPDTVQGVKVTAIGGFTGELKKAPTAGLAITMPETYRGAERAHYTMPSGAVEITLPVHIHIGRYVREVQPDAHRLLWLRQRRQQLYHHPCVDGDMRRGQRDVLCPGRTALPACRQRAGAAALR